MPLAVGVLIRRTKELIYCDAGSADISVNSAVLVETENGMEAGVVMQPEQMVNVKGQLRKIARLCTAEDFRHIKKQSSPEIATGIIKIENRAENESFNGGIHLKG